MKPKQTQRSSTLKTLPCSLQPRYHHDDSFSQPVLKPVPKNIFKRYIVNDCKLLAHKYQKKFDKIHDNRRLSMKVINYPLNHINCWVQPEARESRKSLFNNRAITEIGEVELQRSRHIRYNIEKVNTQITKAKNKYVSQENSPKNLIHSKGVIKKSINKTPAVAKMLLQIKGANQTVKPLLKHFKQLQ